MDLQTLINKYSVYKHCIVWNGIPSEESALSKHLIYKLLHHYRGGVDVKKHFQLGLREGN